MSRHAEDLDLLRRAARESARIALSFFQRDPEVFWKEGNSPVSQADLAIDGFLRDFLLSARPRYGWVSEETASEPGRGDETRFFVIDPIDGTRSFLRGEKTWCIALAVIEDGRPVAGVIDVPVTGEIFSAQADAGAALNGEPLSVSAHRPNHPLNVSVPDGLRRRLSERERNSLDIAPSIPSLAYRLSLVAAGRLDGTLILPRANDWDIAAADLILERAGGALIYPSGERHLYKLNPKRHGLLIAGAGHAIKPLQRLAASMDL